MSDYEVANGDVRVRVTGLSKTVRNLGRAGVGAQDLKQLMHDIGMLVVRAAKLPVRSGRLNATLRAGKGKTKAVVRAGGARAPYAGVINYGWPAHNIAPAAVPLEATVAAERADILEAINDGVEDLLRKNDLL